MLNLKIKKIGFFISLLISFLFVSGCGSQIVKNDHSQEIEKQYNEYISNDYFYSIQFPLNFSVMDNLTGTDFYAENSDKTEILSVFVSTGSIDIFGNYSEVNVTRDGLIGKEFINDLNGQNMEYVVIFKKFNKHYKLTYQLQKSLNDEKHQNLRQYIKDTFIRKIIY